MYKVERKVLQVTDEDLVTRDFGFAGRKLVDVSLNYSARIEGKWREIARYDNAHGIFHFHRFWLPQNEIRTVRATTRPVRPNRPGGFA